jgi:hypothetical protein
MTRTMLALFVLCVPALARDNGQYYSVSPEVRQWFRAQKSPKTGALCCNEADGTYAEEDIRNGVYWTRFDLTKGMDSSPLGRGHQRPQPQRRSRCVVVLPGWQGTDSVLRAGWRCLMNRRDEHRPGRLQQHVGQLTLWRGGGVTVF